MKQHFDICLRPAVHLEHETYLLVSLSFLLFASFQSLYNDSFGLRGDFIFVFMAFLWLGRYTASRWVCVSDKSTNANPTIRGVLAHWVTSHIFSGQYFDRMPPQLLAKQGIGATRAEEDFSGIFQGGSIKCTWNVISIRLLFPLLRKREAIQQRMRILSMPSSQDTAPQSGAKRRGAENRSASYLNTRNKLYSSLEPILQAALPACALLYFSWRLPFAKYLTQADPRKSVDNFQTTESPPIADVSFFIAVPIMFPLLLFSRLINPIPDLVAGSNVLKAVRNEAKAYGGVSNKSSKSKVQVHESPQQMCSWAEQNKSIVSQPRLRLFLRVSCLRILENIYIVAILPWTGYACRATGHCHDGIQLWQLSSVLFPVGITTTLRADANTSNEFDYDPDYLSALITIGSVVVVSGILLLSQAVALNGSYLAITGYVCGEWTAVDLRMDPTIKTASQWDARRRYKKGDVVAMKCWGRQVFYKASSNSPEGRPFDMLLRATHDVVSKELGHPSTSGLLAAAVKGHLLLIAICVLFVMFNTLIRGNNSNGMLSALVGNIIGCYGAINAAMRNRKELQRLNDEIRRQIPLFC